MTTTNKATLIMTFLFYLSFFLVWGYTGPSSKNNLPHFSRVDARSIPDVKIPKWPHPPKYYNIERAPF